MISGYQGLIFDCDGTLVNSMPAHYVAWNATMEKYGIHFPEKRFYELGGVPTDKIVALLAGEAGIELDPQQVAVEKDDLFLHNVDQVEGIEKVVDIARQGRGKVPMAVATGSSQAMAKAELEQIGILDWFETVVASDDVENHKPAPDVYLKAAKGIHVAPQHCLAFEDTNIGIQAAEAAGMTVIDIRTL